MSRIKRLLLISIGLVIVGVVGCLLTFHQLAEATAFSKEKTVHADFSKVQVDSDNAEVVIKPTKGDIAKAVLSGQKANDSSLDFNVYDDHGTLHIELNNKMPGFFNFNFFVSKIGLKIYLPEKQYDSMVVENHNGKVQLGDFNTTNLTATTNNGLIELNNVHTKKANVRTNNGRVSLNHVDGALDGRTDNGEIIVVTKDLDRPMDLACDNGRIRIKTDKDPTNVTFAAHVDNGHINILDKYNGYAVIGNGKNLIKLSTNNGSITITK